VSGEAVDGGQAVEAAGKLRPDVVLMDIQMPFIDGIEATRRIKQHLPQTAVIMLTVHNDDDRIFASFAAGADGYCLKGAETARLALAIRSVADGAAWLDPVIASRVLKETGFSWALRQVSPVSAEARMAQNLKLSNRERQILRLVADGLSNPQIARQLTVKPETIKTHIGRIMDKLAVCDRTQAAVKALRQGLL
jgi:DNA-binding NarL/FixJ family response regulator